MRSTARHSSSCHSSATSDGQPPCSWPRRLPLPGISLEVVPRRQYLNERGEADGSLLAHVVGYTGPINADELEAMGADGYLHDDAIGRTGIEAAFEASLRGSTARPAGSAMVRVGS